MGETVTAALAANERLLTVAEAAEVLRVSQRQVYGLVRTGELPCIRVGRWVRISTRDLQKFVESKRS